MLRSAEYLLRRLSFSVLESRVCGLGLRDYLEGHGDSVNRLITLISHVTAPSIPIPNLLTSLHDPPSRVWGIGCRGRNLRVGI